MCFFLSVNDSLISMLPPADAPVRWYIIILILISGVVGIVFFLLLGPSVLLIFPFRLLCQWSLYVNAPFCQCFVPLIDCYIDSWDCWDCVLSIIAPVRPYIHPPPLLFMCIYLLPTPSINDNAFFYWLKVILIALIVGIVIARIVGVVFCLFLQPSFLLVRPFCLSCRCIPLYDFLLMCPSLRFFLFLIDRSIDW